ncbi:MAG: carboxymuconolactone decarboxylase family protein [bacterium]|nr:carboxymuconolactone decarboxylase family protein [bacterium]
MSSLNDRERELVALGAAISSNCVPCIEYHIPQARKAGLSDAQIREAVQLADKVRRVPARKVLQTAYALLGENQGEEPDAATTGCGCSQPAESAGSGVSGGS